MSSEELGVVFFFNSETAVFVTFYITKGGYVKGCLKMCPNNIYVNTFASHYTVY